MNHTGQDAYRQSIERGGERTSGLMWMSTSKGEANWQTETFLSFMTEKEEGINFQTRKRVKTRRYIRICYSSIKLRSIRPLANKLRCNEMKNVGFSGRKNTWPLISYLMLLVFLQFFSFSIHFFHFFLFIARLHKDKRKLETILHGPLRARERERDSR